MAQKAVKGAMVGKVAMDKKALHRRLVIRGMMEINAIVSRGGEALEAEVETLVTLEGVVTAVTVV
jgi:hypothetical protein